MEYKIVRMTNDAALAEEINAKLAIGWKVVGGASYSGQAYMQAMIRETPPKPTSSATPKPKAKAIKKPSPQKKSRVKAGGTADGSS